MTWGTFWRSVSEIRIGSPCYMALAAIQTSLLQIGVPAFLSETAMMAHRSAVSSSIGSTVTREDWRNSLNDLSFFSCLVPRRNPARTSANTKGLRQRLSADSNNWTTSGYLRMKAEYADVPNKNRIISTSRDRPYERTLRSYRMPQPPRAEITQRDRFHATARQIGRIRGDGGGSGVIQSSALIGGLSQNSE